MARTATPNAAAQFETRGYVVSEEADFALRDMAEALDGIALLCEERTDDMPELTKRQWAGILRTFGRQVQTIRADAGFTQKAMCEMRHKGDI